MQSKIVKLFLVAIVIAGAVSYLFYFNPHKITFAYGREQIWEAPLALVVILVFCLGALTAAVLTLFFGFGSFVAERRQRRRDRVWKSHRELLLKGREALAAKCYLEARAVFRRMFEEDQDNIIALIMLAETAAAEGSPTEALQILDQARQTQKSNLEFLFLAARLNKQVGNVTAAYDNYSLALQHSPNSNFALAEAANCAYTLKRYGQAIAHQQELIRLSRREEVEPLQDLLAHMEIAQAKQQFSSNSAALSQELDLVLKRHRDFPAALAEKAALELRAEQPEAASKLLRRAYKLSENGEYLRTIGELWLARSEPTKAVEQLREALLSITRSSTLVGRGSSSAESSSDIQLNEIRGRLVLIDLLLKLEMVEQADAEFRNLDGLSHPPAELKQPIALLKARLLKRHGRTEAAYSALLAALVEEIENEQSGDISSAGNISGSEVPWVKRPKEAIQRTANQPPPTLSTP